MQSWITMNDNHLSNFLDIKNYRKSFIESFDTNDIEIKNKLEKSGCKIRFYKGDEISRKGEGGPTCLTRPLIRN